jgi:excinuclease UvrABC ATPase subunit
MIKVGDYVANETLKVHGKVVYVDESTVAVEDRRYVVLELSPDDCRKAQRCYRCFGSGWVEVLTGFSEDDTAPDICPECNGKGYL